MSNIDINDSRNSAIINSSIPDNWRDAVNNLVSFWAQEGRCFSSGEVAACLRTHAPALRFSVPKVGEFLRDLFYTGLTSANGNPLVQVPRFTVGKFPDRTPAQTEVFVYGPTPEDCAAHEFEVYVPKPGETLADAPAPAATQPEVLAGSPQAVAILGTRAAGSDVKATVWPDGRLCISRPALELAVHLGGKPMTGGQPVFVKLGGTEVVITLEDDGTGGKPYSISAEKGRVAFPSLDPSKPFKPGATCKLTVTAGKITVDLTGAC